jgi:photosystem II stability/assembly factor-like uncharacterized protein
MYHRIRKPWHFHSGGPDGGLFKTSDGGKSWSKLTRGLPAGDIGRVGIDICRSKPEVVVASVEANDQLPADMSIPGPGVYRSDDGGETWRYLLRHTSRPMYHGRIAVNPLDDNLIYVIARDFRFSADGGKSFRGKPWRGAGGDDHDLWISPRDKNVLYVASDQGAHLTVDHGKSFVSFNNMAIAQYYAIGVDLRDPYWVYGGMQDIGGFGGPSNSRDYQGILNDHNVEVNGGDGFHMQVDPTDWRTVYTVCHVGGLGRINMETREYKLISPRQETISNFDKYYDPDFPETPVRYSIFPGEHWLWRQSSRSSYSSLLPPQFRYNWSSPVIVSSHNPRTIYFGGNHVFKSEDRGDVWQIISPDLTTDDPEKRNSSDSGGLTHEVTGAENHCTIITISESPMDASILWVGTDDGNVQVTRDGGANWTNVRPNIQDVPHGIWVSRVEASHFQERSAYVTFDGHRSDDFTPYVFKTDDFGATWTNIAGNIPDGNSLYVIKEDYKNENLLFVGSEFACFATIDSGKNWHRFMNDMPTVAFHDLVIHPRDFDLVAGTHGRSIWIVDDLTPLQQLTPEVLSKDVHFFENRTATRWQSVSLGRQQTFFKFRGENPQSGAFIHFYLKSKPEGKVTMEIQDLAGTRKVSVRVSPRPGLNKVRWDMRFPPTQPEIEAFKARLEKTINGISSLVKTDREQKVLSEMQERLKNAKTDRDLIRINRQMISEFAFYSEGRDLFGTALVSTDAPAGTYKVILTIDGRPYSGAITIRKDPLLK